ncbi:MAG: amino acid ABC transporter permease [Alphaproteobacteria bacterium]|nr:amino acid ABC transporter permease [Alphaproteobacteria bacterium]
MSAGQRAYPPGQHPDLPPPAGTVGPLAWARANLLSTPFNIALTLAALGFLLWAIPPLVDWAILSADFAVHDSSRACTGAGACWAVVSNQPEQYLWGFYPADSLWRPALVALYLLGVVYVTLARRVPFRRKLLWGVAAFPFLAAWLLHGGLGLDIVSTRQWGGFLLTLVVGVTGIIASLPFGILLALGRRSELPLIRALSTGFIETIRGIPLIIFLFFASVMLPLFFPEGVSFDKLVRVLIVVVMFSGAYMAEVIRGGLQAVPRGQFEAASALGLGYWQAMGLIVLPQALRIAIPGIVNNFIALFKDTSLVAIIGLFDLLGTAQLILRNENWIAAPEEAYVFVALLFWIPCFLMSRYSLSLERRLDAAPRAVKRAPAE